MTSISGIVHPNPKPIQIQHYQHNLCSPCPSCLATMPVDMSRISVTNRDDFVDNTSDPAASLSVGSDDNPAGGGGGGGGETSRQNSSSTNPAASTSSPVASPDSSLNQRNQSTSSAAARSGSTSTSRLSQAERDAIEQLRAILTDSSEEELLTMARDTIRASENTQQSSGGGGVTRATRRTSRLGRSSNSRGGARRSWAPCQPAPSRPGAISYGGPIDTNATYNIGQTDEMELEIKRIEAVSAVQDALNERLGYNLRESGKYEEAERLYQEGERLLSSTGLGGGEGGRSKKLLPPMKIWGAPPISQKSMNKKEPPLPEPGEPLPMPLTFGGHEGNGELQLGKFVGVGPDRDEDEQKREISLDTWATVPIDETTPGPYDQVVRCWKCRAGLRVHIEVGLVACPRCRSISPTTDIANIG